MTARVHPGETPCSHILEGFLENLASDNPVARALMKQYVFHIIPVLNPDGVELGLHRTDTQGENLNRTYGKTRGKYPTIQAACAACMSAHREQGGLRLYIDLHAHSTKRGAFLINEKAGPDTTSRRLFAYALSRHCSTFEYAQCIDNHGPGTGKTFISSKIKVPLCFTLETNYVRGHHSPDAYVPQVWRRLGASLLEALFDVDLMEAAVTGSPQHPLAKQRSAFVKDLLVAAAWLGGDEQQTFPVCPGRARPRFALVLGPSASHQCSRSLMMSPELAGREVEVIEERAREANCAARQFRLHECDGGVWLEDEDLSFRESQRGRFFYTVLSMTYVTAEASPTSSQVGSFSKGVVLEGCERRVMNGELRIRLFDTDHEVCGWVSEYKTVAFDPRLGGMPQLMRLRDRPASFGCDGRSYMYR